MEIKRETMIETCRRISVSRPLPDGVVGCPFCAAPEQLLTAEHAAANFGVSRRAIYRLVEQGAAHFVENSNGEVLLCPASLDASSEK